MRFGPPFAGGRHIISDPDGLVSRENLFHNVKGAKCLAQFLLTSNSLLRPLPARPDPP